MAMRAIKQSIADRHPAPAAPEVDERGLPVALDGVPWVVEGLGAGELFLNLKTVRNHVSNIFTKLQVADRAQAIVRAREAGLGRRGG
jgi:hypothetical protein